jgi:hypothetical protein
MRTASSHHDLGSRAARALRALLNQVSVIRLIDIRSEASDSGGDCVLIADIDVLGRRYTLAADVRPAVPPESLRSLFKASVGSEMEARIIIAPHLSAEAQALCKLNHAGFLDLDGNARISLGEVFIGRRSTACRPAHRPADQPALPIAKIPLREGAFPMPLPPRAVSGTARGL